MSAEATATSEFASAVVTSGFPAAVSVIDHDTLTRDLRNCIATFPVTARHKDRLLVVRLMATQDMLQAVEAGTSDTMSMGVIAVRDDFGDLLPKSMDDFYIMFKGKWLEFQIRNVPDYFDPRVHIITIDLISTHKGIV